MTDDNNNRVTVAKLDVRVTHLESEMKEMRDCVEAMNQKLTGILVALATSALLFAVNLLVNGFGP